MAGVKQMFLLIVFQGFYLGSVGQRWTFPSTMVALIGSCVEIPCTYHPVRDSGNSSTRWYIYKTVGYPEVLNTKDSSSVMKDYRGRTSLVPGENSCTLRIDPVRREDDQDYYPGIAEDNETNAYEKQGRYVRLDVTESPGIVDLSGSWIMKEGEAATIRCSVDHTCRSSPPSLQWNKPGQIKRQSVEISGGSWREESELTYIPSYVDDESSVQCTTIYPNGRRTEKSGTLDIIFAPKNVTITINGNQELMEGSDVTLQCNSFSKPVVYEYEWYKGKTRLPDRGREMTVYNVTGDMEPYSCTAINRVGRGESAPAQIPVLLPPQHVTVTILGNGQIMEGTDVTLVCTSISRPEATEYEWYKGRNKTRLPYTGWKMTVYNVTGNMEPYSCTAINRVGRGESALTEIPVLYSGGSGHSGIESNCNIILLATIGTVCPLLVVVVLVYLCWRNRSQNATSSEAPDFPNATYTDLVIDNTTSEYEELKPVIPPKIAGGHGGATFQTM